MVDELVSIGGVADRLGVSVSRARQIVEDNDEFPKPKYTFGTGRRLWTPEAVEAFAASYQPRPVGRPRNTPERDKS